MRTDPKLSLSSPTKADECVPAIGFDSEILHNLVGFFDVLIQMDLEQKSKEQQRDKSNRS